ncbi:hypothetical protein PSN45_000727 [Yamadazyma tenuis]|uniref:Metal-dependent protein hydrolase n=1 Tax=Candida tenuis (strain ATCC 10573 / BCRC 21748 / CBS 615 / JCM 9827 / NBRC 10315 / NRRL Y-1498 / VKM Y-70) TaxID=590646 RepID=G3BA52_CANTC|nr:metal-dependent protein hydrolase [Yamadazyma tenuis ATCC 10573]EGV62012.1 metal-dependent protein hydrolase [Yamadazyma tenuis ATCC 10573]WEJ93265.1 hypothetical protein PSN45_000727 [Yamadazyma tenuis]
MSKICTHSGSFHADESLAVYMLQQLPKYSQYDLIRSRDPKDWEESEIVIDVSGKYDGEKYFDHHQREFFETFPGFSTKLSSAGLIYKHFGQDIIKHKLNLTDSVQDSEIIKGIWEKIYKEFIESIDANDNGISKYDESATASLEPKFVDRSLMLPSIIANLNPQWYNDPTPEDFDKQFLKSSALMGQVFENVLEYHGVSWVKSKAIVEDAIKGRFDVDKSGAIIKLEKYCQWKTHLYNTEKELGIEEAIKFVLYKDSSNSWRISTVSVNSGSFEFRLGIKEKWRGIRDEELSKMVGIEDGIFVHANGFIGGAKSFESALKIARESL